MSITAHTSRPGIKPNLRQGTRRSSDVEQQAYAAVGRRFAEGGSAKIRQVRAARLVFAVVAGIAVLMLVTLVALLTYENINSPHARKVAASARADQQGKGIALATSTAGKPVVIIDEKEEPPKRPIPAPQPVPPLVMLAPAELQAPAPAAPARLATAARKPAKPRDAAKAAAAGKLALAKAGKAARKGARKDAPPSPAKRRASLGAAGPNGGALDTLLSYASIQRRHLAEP
ncbi:hypothetical protein HF313_13755 [Massilia atriviolacea]|uniref:Uncharacterized protein n=1 Tax=Massilia atriviolacea TaxID=2495579 RepID=A0A430HQJ8_9BURK|nr:hypothetical protein [Massilia atriviolacea]RSZ59801.1 hypothetical protein EJB06_06280 [Massilia atriviolacea]